MRRGGDNHRGESWRCAIETLDSRRLLAGPIAIPPMLPNDQNEVILSRLNGNLGAFSAVSVIGSVAQPRVPISFSRGSYQLVGAGTGIGGSADGFTFASRPATGDGSIVARVTGLANTGSARAGIVIRSSTSASAAFAAILITPSNGLIFSRRLVDGGASSQSFLPGVAAPRFLKLTREGNSVSVFHSADGATWTQFGSAVNVALGADPRVGLAATATSTTATTTASFTNVSVLLPLGTDINDIGPATIGGYASYSASTNTYSISGSAVDAGGSGDEIGLVSRTTLGKGALVATVDGFVASPSTSAAGLMLRSALGAGSPFASIMATPAGQVQFRWRNASNGATSSSNASAGTGGVSVKLERDGDVVRAFYSIDRVTWTQLGSAQSISFASSRAIGGLAIRSGTAGQLATANISSFGQLGNDNTLSLDVGNPSAGGSPLFDTVRNTHTMLGRGVGVGSADSLSLAGQTMTGDGDVVAYVSGFTPTSSQARAGIMLRASATTNSSFAGIFLTSTGLVVHSRASFGAPLSSSFVNGVAGPLSLKLTRIGNGIAARYSTDGVTWLNAGSTMTIALGTSPIAAMAVASGSETALASASFTGFDAGTKLATGAGLLSPADEFFLNDLQARSVQFYWAETNPNTGLALDGSSANGGSPSGSASIASVGFGLSGLALADERGFLTHAEAYGRVLTTLNFLYNNVPHVNGFFYHFLNPATGARSGTSELSPIDTALLMAGVLHAAEYWEGTAIETVANNLYNRVNWPWMQKPNGQFYGHWTPENGFEYGYGDFSEAVLLYLLGLGSSTHPISTASWNSWSRSPVINYSGSTFITAQTRALFTVQYPLAWFDLRGKADAFGLNYFDNATKATLAQRTLAINLSGTYPQYGANVWGLTAADGPNGYTVWGGPPATSNVDGSVVPTAPGGSLAFTPRRSVDALRTMQASFPTTYRKYGFVDAFNPHTNWTSSIVLGIDLGMMLLAAENVRSAGIWDSFMQSPVAQSALVKAFGASARSDESETLQPMTDAIARIVSRRAGPRVADELFSQQAE
jgi:hypothetical protein